MVNLEFIKTFCSAKDTAERMKRPDKPGEIFAKHVFDKGLVTKLYKELLKIQQISKLPNFKIRERSEQTSDRRRHTRGK